MFWMSPRNRVLALSSVLGLLVGLLLIATITPGRPYSVANTGASGLSALVKERGAVWITSLSELGELEPRKTLLVLARTKPLSQEEIDAVKAFAASAGYVVAYGKAEFVENLAEQLGLELQFKGRVLDPVFNAGSQHHVLVNESICGGNLVVHAPYGVEGLKPEETLVLAWSSPLSYLDLNGNGYYDATEPMGSSPTGVVVEFDQGKVLILFTELLLENSLIEHNDGFLECIGKGRAVVVDQSEVRGYALEYSRLLLHSPRGRIYVVALAVIMLVVAYYAHSAKR